MCTCFYAEITFVHIEGKANLRRPWLWLIQGQNHLYSCYIVAHIHLMRPRFAKRLCHHLAVSIQSYTRAAQQQYKPVVPIPFTLIYVAAISSCRGVGLLTTALPHASLPQPFICISCVVIVYTSALQSQASTYVHKTHFLLKSMQKCLPLL